MSLAFESASDVQTVNGALYSLGSALDICPATVSEYTGQLVSVQPLDEEGKPIQVSAAVIREVVAPPKDDYVGWEQYLALIKAQKAKVDVPPTIGRLSLHDSGAYFSVYPETPSESRATPPRLFRIGMSRVLPLLELPADQ